MQTNLADFIRDTAAGQEADRILRACVHCGFCNATCPTYQLLGDELETPSCFCQTQPVGYHLAHRQPVSLNQFQRHCVVSGATSVGGGKRYVVAKEKVVY